MPLLSMPKAAPAKRYAQRTRFYCAKLVKMCRGLAVKRVIPCVVRSQAASGAAAAQREAGAGSHDSIAAAAAAGVKAATEGK